MKYALQPWSQPSRKAPSARPVARTSNLELPTSNSLPLCFHILTNCFSRNPFVFTFIRIAPGVTPNPTYKGKKNDPANG